MAAVTSSTSSYRASPVMNAHHPMHLDYAPQQQQQYNHPLQQQRNMYTASPVPREIPGHSVRYHQGKAYVNLQGQQQSVQYEQAASNVSSSSSGHQRPQVLAQQQYYDDTMSTYVDPVASSAFYDDQRIGDHEDFAAANLLMTAPSHEVPGDYNDMMDVNDGGGGGGQAADAAAAAAAAAPAQSSSSASDGDDAQASLDKLSTIKEEIDAEEVVARIDGLLL